MSLARYVENLKHVYSKLNWRVRSGNIDVQIEAAGALQNMTFAPTLRLTLAANQEFMDTISMFLQHEDEGLRRAAASAVWNLAAQSGNRITLASMTTVVDPLIRLFQGQSMDVLEHVCFKMRE